MEKARHNCTHFIYYTFSYALLCTPAHLDNMCMPITLMEAMPKLLVIKWPSLHKILTISTHHAQIVIHIIYQFLLEIKISIHTLFQIYAVMLNL